LALKILKLAINSHQNFSTSPLVTRLFYEVPETVQSLTTYKINTNDFLNDSGEVVETLPVLNLNNNYFHVFVNGVLQMDDTFAYTAGEQGIGSLIISVPEESEIPAGSPIVLEIVNFYPKTIG
jgi:hypothetical protein